MTFSSLLRLTLWLMPSVLQVAIVVVMIARKLVRIFPTFFCYSIFVPLRDVVLLFLQNSPNLYGYVYWVGEVLTIFFGLLALYEVLCHLVYPYPFLRSLARNIFKTVGLGALAIASLTVLMVAEFKRTIELVILLDRAAGMVRVALLIGVILFVSRLGLTWKHYATGILAGFGIGGLQVVAAELWAAHLISNETLKLLLPAIYNCAAFSWAFYFVLSGERRLVSESLPETDLSRWNEALKDYLSK